MHFTQSLPLALGLAGAAMAKTIVVSVSDTKGELIYTPNNIQADIGDSVEFIFYPKNHTVSESAFMTPCMPLSGNDGFNSGFMPVTADATEQPTWTYLVADTNPHWFYCAQGKHCQSGMVGVINPPASKPENNINSFAALAKNASANIAPSKIQGGIVGTTSVNSTSSSNTTNTDTTSTVSGTLYSTTWTVTSGTDVLTEATTELVASFAAETVTSAVVFTSNGNIVTSQSIVVQTAPVLATAAPGSGSSSGSDRSGSSVNKAAAGMGVAAAAGVAAAILL